MADREDFDKLLASLGDRNTSPEILAETVAKIGKCEDKTKILEVKDLVAPLFAHGNPYVRHEVALTLGLWGLAEYKDKFLHMLRNDPDEHNRGTAALALGSALNGRRDAETLRSLAEVVRNESETSDVRATAYGALLRVFGKSNAHEDLRLPYRIEDINVDWRLVDSVSA